MRHPWKQTHCLKDRDRLILFFKFSISSRPQNNPVLDVLEAHSVQHHSSASPAPKQEDLWA